MSDETDEGDEPPSRRHLAAERTDYAEDRTMLANERTFGGWARTAMAAIGIGVGFQALFDQLQPAWVPKAVATLFVVLGVFIVFMAERRACRINQRLTAHEVGQVPALNIRVIAIAIALGAATLIAGIWLLY